MDNELRDSFFNFLADREISLKKAAGEMGYASRVLTSYKKGTYKRNILKLEKAMAEWLEIEKRKILSFRVGYVRTEISKKIYNAMSLAHAEKTIAFISAPEGYGKTCTAERYKKTTSDVILVECFPDISPNGLVRLVADQCGKIKAHRINDLKMKVAKYLKERNCLIVFDEADSLSGKAVETARRIFHDIGKSAIVFLDRGVLMTHVSANPGKYKQLGQRIGVHANCADMTFSLTEARRIAATVKEIPREYAKSVHLKSIYKQSRKNPSIFCTLLKRVLKTAYGDVSRVSETVIKKSRDSIWAITREAV